MVQGRYDIFSAFASIENNLCYLEMIGSLEQIFHKAIECGLESATFEGNTYCIKPKEDALSWVLSYEKGRWVLIIKGVPQIYFQHQEVIDFLGRFSTKRMTSWKDQRVDHRVLKSGEQSLRHQP